jgi:hypothetical protein
MSASIIQSKKGPFERISGSVWLISCLVAVCSAPLVYAHKGAHPSLIAFPILAGLFLNVGLHVFGWDRVLRTCSNFLVGRYGNGLTKIREATRHSISYSLANFFTRIREATVQWFEPNLKTANERDGNSISAVIIAWAAERSWMVSAVGVVIASATIYFFDSFQNDEKFHVSNPWGSKALSIGHEIGVAIIIGAMVAVLFHLYYTKRRFEISMKDLKATLSTVQTEAIATDDAKSTASTMMNRTLAELHRNMIKQHFMALDYVGVPKQVGIARFFKRYHEDTRFDPELQKAIESAISEATSFIYLTGRSFSDSISRDQRAASHLWMWSAIEQRLSDKSKPRLEISFLLPNIFSRRNSALQRERVELRRAGSGQNLDATRLVLEFLVNRLVDFKREHVAEVRLVDRPMPFFSVITEKKLFIEHYHPNRPEGESFVSEALNTSDSWQHSEIAYFATRPDQLIAFEPANYYKSVVRGFVQMRNETISASVAISGFLTRIPKLRNRRYHSEALRRFENALAIMLALEKEFARRLEYSEADAADTGKSTPPDAQEITKSQKKPYRRHK